LSGKRKITARSGRILGDVGDRIVAKAMQLPSSMMVLRSTVWMSFAFELGTDHAKTVEETAAVAVVVVVVVVVVVSGDSWCEGETQTIAAVVAVVVVVAAITFV
jgi:hypothetical protein